MEPQKMIRKELPVVACQTIDLLEAAVSRELQKKNPHATLRVGLLGVVALGLIAITRVNEFSSFETQKLER
ncbi:hypothetical protein [Lacticaseibacillus paracasei]|uniref:hypothetical protein n=1 Tax=Lacticaseibacillus paracasei TaxID=1597 RepID=UPI001C0F40E9|nr:hypothetical protein [Lacticaseibacillus paracasei]MBU5324073.1 hypothetical protein [Lacticaseibacillus paracasei]